MTATTPLDPKAAYASAAAAHRAAVRRAVAVGEVRRRHQHRLDRCIEAGIDTTAAKRDYDEADAEYRRLNAEADEANRVGSEARQALTGEAPQARPKPVAATSVATKQLSAVEVAVAAGEVVSKDYLAAALATTVENERRTAAAMEYRLRSLLELANADRVAAVVGALKQVPFNRNLKHGRDCWQRHTGCLAERLYALLDGKAVA